MNRFWNITWLSLLLCGPGLRGQDLLEDLRAPLERALTQPWAERYDELYDGWELQYGGVEALFDELLRRVGDGDAEQAARLRWIASFVAWRDGRSDRALRLCKQVLEHRSDALTRMRLARLLDIGGRPTAAEAAYREVLAVESD